MIGKNFGLAKIARFDFARVFKKFFYGIVGQQSRKLRLGHAQSIDLPVEERFTSALGSILAAVFDHANDRAVARLDRCARIVIVPMMHRGDIPLRIFRRHAVFVDQHAAHPDRRRLHPAQKADFFAVQIRRVVNTRSFAA